MGQKDTVGGGTVGDISGSSSCGKRTNLKELECMGGGRKDRQTQRTAEGARINVMMDKPHVPHPKRSITINTFASSKKNRKETC